jgi:hypothetical protein
MKRVCGILFALSLASALVWTWSGQAQNPTDPDHAAKMAKGLDLFKQQIRPVLSQRCVKCHGGEKTEAKLDLTDRAGLLKGGESGPAVIVGKAKDSLLIKLLRHEKEPKMPKEGGKLSDASVNEIAAWIDLGAPYDKPLLEKPDAQAWIHRQVDAEARKFWAFQPLKRVEPPKVKDSAWCRSPIDLFIRAKQEAAGLTPNPTVDRRKLIRRVYFDVLGLPPTPKEVNQFLNDTSPTAYEDLIDRLLASPHYGERWARHWLDLARFAESHGFEHDYDRPTAYHYRDFVIQALNKDLPFDKFVKWQLAGDEYEPTNPLAWMATGFLAAGVHSTQITKNEVERQRYDELDDMLATTGTAFLGLTIGCARCHDHKYDPIPQADYYQMLSTFTTTIRSEYDLTLDTAAYDKAKAEFDRQHQPLVEALARFEKEQLPGRFAKWEQARGKQAIAPAWILPTIHNVRSTGEATLTKQPDGSVLVSGKNPPIEDLVFVLHTDLKNITGIRLEALTDPSLVKNGPGRAANGNFALTDFRIVASPNKKPDPDKAGSDRWGKPIPIKLNNPRADFEQKGLPIAAAIDNDPVTSGWAIDPQFGKDHVCAFTFEKPVSFPEGTVLGVTLAFHNNVGHGMGRPRLSLTTSEKPLDLNAPLMPEIAARALELPAEKRTPEQTQALLVWYRQLDSEWQALHKKIQDHLLQTPKPHVVKALVSSEGLPPVRLHTQGDDFLPQTHFLRRGDTEQKEAVAPPGFLQVLMTSGAAEKRWQRTPPTGSKSSFRRTAFAEWLTDTDQGAGRLLARVIVNRLWQHHLGRGIVATPSDFGTRGEPPTHPELLDWLASELIARNWKLKEIQKLILTSAVYMQESGTDDSRLKIDRENKFFWHHPGQRLEAEVIRDSLLYVSGMLDETMLGPGTLDENSRRRSIYFTVKRSKLMPMMTVFDAPEALTGVAERPATTIAPQALLLMNNPHVRAWAKNFAKRVAPDAKTPPEDAIRRAYLAALSRPPSAEEMADDLEFLKTQTVRYQQAGKADARELALADFCQALMCLNEFVFVE